MQYAVKGSQTVYTFNQGCIIYFRQVVPADLRPLIRRSEFRASLATHDKRAAKRKAALLSARIWDIFNGLRKGDKRMMTLTAEQIQELVKSWIKKELEEDETSRALNVRRGYIYDKDDEGESPYSVGLDEAEYRANEALAENTTEKFASNIAHDLIKQNDVQVNSDAVEYKLLCRELTKAQIELCKALRSRDRNKYPNTYIDSKTLKVKERAPKSDSISESPVKKQQKITLSKAFEAYRDEALARNRWTPKTEQTIKKAVGIFIDMTGDIRLCDITQDTLRQAQKDYFNFPKNKCHVKQYKDMTIEQLRKIVVPEHERLSNRTIENNFLLVNGFLRWLSTMYELPTWINTILTMPKKSVAEDTRTARDMFSAEDLNKIFNDPFYVTGAPTRANAKKLTAAMFWLPLMALYSGARLEELAQLYLADFKIIDGIKCYEFTPFIEEDGKITIAEDKRVKNPTSRRVVPIHDKLLELGLWEYVEELKKQGKARLFEELTAYGADKKFSAAYSKWFNRNLHNRLKITGNDYTGKKVFYSFRHTFINYCLRNKINERCFESFVGHKLKGNEATVTAYAKGLPPKMLKAEVLDKMDYGIDLSHLKGHKFARCSK
ncbi:MAG: site-specific integrase [Synergistaceae bacterium]|nr:site-specific integrase [Synergistaceae bacterium]